MSQEILEGSLKLVREHALIQAMQLVQAQFKNTGDPRPLYQIMTQLKHLIEETKNG